MVVMGRFTTELSDGFRKRYDDSSLGSALEALKLWQFCVASCPSGIETKINSLEIPVVNCKVRKREMYS